MPLLSGEELATVIRLRHALHETPELSGQEHATAARLRDFLTSAAPDRVIEGLGGTGLAVVFAGHVPGPRVLIRAELDGLPITEATGLPYASRYAGRAHLCGHDGHMAILAALGLWLARNRPHAGEVVLLFQPAEETGEGARAVLADPRFASLRPDWAFALHNMPGLALGSLAVAPGAASCASCGLRIRLSGRESHAAHPEAGLSPAPAVAALIAALARHAEAPPMGPSFRLATLCHLSMGAAAFGIAPGTAELLVTLRAFDDAGLATLEREIMASISAAAGPLAVAITRHDHFHATQNDPEAVAHILQARAHAGLAPGVMPLPMRASEDFGAFSAAGRAALFFLGSGETQPALHRPDFDFPDALIAPGLAIFAQLVTRLTGDAVMARG